jgi:hypothetical protein
VTYDMHEDPADDHADMILTAEKESFERDLDPSDFIVPNGEYPLLPRSAGAPEFVGAYGRVYTRTDTTDHAGEPIWEDDDGDAGTIDELEAALARAEAGEAMGDEAPF